MLKVFHCSIDTTNSLACYDNTMSQAKAPTLQSVAREAGVSAMTVSRVMRQSPRVDATTRRRVLAAAQSLNYRPNPHLMRMMKLVRSHKQSRSGAVLAVIREERPQNELAKPAYQYVAIEDVRRRAEQHGYHVEEFWLGRDGLTPERLVGILQARGIEGLIVSPQSSQMLCARLNFAPFAVATFGYGLRQPSLHRATANMTLGIHLAAAQLAARGYQRIGLAITQWVDDRAENTYSGAMLHYQQSLPRRCRVPLLLFQHNDLTRCSDSFMNWMKTHRPDVLISFDKYVTDWLKKLGLRVPQDIGLVVHDWTQTMKGFAGIHHRRDQVANAAVDALATQLMHHERGVPEVPRQILIPPAWIEGPSIRPPVDLLHRVATASVRSPKNLRLL